jgi:perosamine synthetase
LKTYWEEDDVQAVASVIRRGTCWATGPEIEQFEEGLASYVGMNYAIVVKSGTSAQHLDLLAHGIDSGEVIVPSFTFTSAVNCVGLIEIDFDPVPPLGA